MEKEEVFYIVAKRVITKRASPDGIINIAELKHTLGEVFRITHELLFYEIKDLIKHKVITPTTSQRWVSFKVDKPEQ